MEPLKRISCQRCQVRKIKCTRKSPCSNCLSSGHECKFRDNDTKRRPVAGQYVQALENRVAWFESFIGRLQSASDKERDELLKGVLFQDHLPKTGSPTGTGRGTENVNVDGNGEVCVAREKGSISLQNSVHGSLLYHGPTSMYQEELLSGKTIIRARDCTNRKINNNTTTHSAKKPLPSIHLEQDFISEALSLFFSRQYPQFMFIYREAFLKDYYDQVYGGKYWSYSLLYAICVLGATVSPDRLLRGRCVEISTYAQQMIITNELGRPTITTVQALLCLAFYEIGNGNHSKGWSLSGMAFRIGQELGFQQDPALWVGEDSAINSQEDQEIRRRIYWGCYVTDKLISLYLGRPVFLHEEDADVDPTEPLPDLPETHTWFKLNDVIKAAARLRIVRAFKCMIDLSKSVQDILSQVFSLKHSQRSDTLEALRSSRLSHLNTSLARWHSVLPADIQLTKSATGSNLILPHVAMVHILYHSILISLNRHFVRPSPGFPLNISSKDICESSANNIITILRQLRAQNDLRNSPVIFVYGAVMAASAILLSKPTVNSRGVEETRLSFLLKALEECSGTYVIAAEASAKIRRSLMRYRSGAEGNMGDGPSTESEQVRDVDGSGMVIDSALFVPDQSTNESEHVPLWPETGIHPESLNLDPLFFNGDQYGQSVPNYDFGTNNFDDYFGGTWMPSSIYPDEN